MAVGRHPVGESMKSRTMCGFALSIGVATTACAQKAPGSQDAVIRNANGIRLLVQTGNPGATLGIVLPGHVASDRAIEVIFPEHVTAVRHNSATSEQLYTFRRGLPGGLSWRRTARAFEYEGDLPEAVHMLARATLEDDGVRFHYEFSNRSGVAYDMIYGVTDPRLTSMFHDVRLERTYVHHADGFDLLASESPNRLTIPLDQWLPARYLASFTWPVPAERIKRSEDGITYYTKSRAVDEPFIATLSSDGIWVVASFAPETGNVWSNPELTCQHVDPQMSLSPRGHAIVETKLLILRGSLDDALNLARKQRPSLKMYPRSSPLK